MTCYDTKCDPSSAGFTKFGEPCTTDPSSCRPGTFCVAFNGLEESCREILLRESINFFYFKDVVSIHNLDQNTWNIFAIALRLSLIYSITDKSVIVATSGDTGGAAIYAFKNNHLFENSINWDQVKSASFSIHILN